MRNFPSIEGQKSRNIRDSIRGGKTPMLVRFSTWQVERADGLISLYGVIDF
jgi:hypothetical protein